MAKNYLIDLTDTRLPTTIGNKARNLRLLIEKGFPIPRTYVISWDAFSEYCADHTEIVPQIQTGLGQIITPGRLYAVRSSANVEDSLAYSFAGQFKSVLNVAGVNAVLAATWSIWATATSDQVKFYLDKLPPEQGELKMAVIIQEMVSPVVSGVAFSKNPVNAMDEIVVEAVQGQGDALVQNGATPGRWVYKWGRCITEPMESEISRDVIAEVVAHVQRVVKTFKRDVDIEWVYDGQKVYIVQMRDITSITGITVYSNAIAKDMLPGLIRPLIWSINFPAIADSWKQFLTEILGPNDIQPLSLAKLFHYRAYFNMTVFGAVFNQLGLPGESLDMMIGVAPGGAQMPKMRMQMNMLRLLPRLIPLMWDKWHFQKRMDAMLAEASAARQTFHAELASQMSETELLGEIERLIQVVRRMVYCHKIGQILMYIYSGILRGQLKKYGVDFNRFDLLEGMDEIHQYDPGPRLQKLHDLFSRLDPALQERVSLSNSVEIMAEPGLAEFQAEFRAFLDWFGHLSDSGNDFSSVPWRETPDLILGLIINYRDAGSAAAERIGLQQVGVKGLQRLSMQIIYRQARLFRLYREKIGFLYTYLYGLLRVYYLALADHLVRRGVLLQRDDIFFLYREEAIDAVQHGADGTFAEMVRKRQQEMMLVQDAPLPGIIYGDQAPPIINVSDHRLNGTPSSRGYYTGPARVVRGIQDFHKVQSGDVLVVPFSDVGWTPLFARAGGVVAESGGMLSHSAIIAREYNIPAVVSVNGALTLCDDMIITVDGYKGEVFIHSGAIASS